MADSVMESSATPQWPDNPSQYELKEIIGVSSIAYIYSAYCNTCNEKCAIKVMGISKFNTPTPSLLQKLKDVKSDSKADIWSVGITAIEMATENPPYYKHPPMKVINLTLLNDPPNIDTSAEQKNQYKMYGKTFRKFITLCLNKESAKRPTARELLQHPFLQRAKDNKLITQTVVPVGPSYVSRVLKAKKQPEPEERIRLQRTRSGEWEWRSMEESLHEDKEKRPSGLQTIWSTIPKKGTRTPEARDETQVEDIMDISEMEFHQRSSSIPEVHSIQPGPSRMCRRARQMDGLPIVYRHRKNGVLQDVKFTYTLHKNSPESLAEELVREGILDPKYSVPVAHYLSRLIENYVNNQGMVTFTFPLNSTGPNADDVASIMGIMGRCFLSLWE